MAVPDFQSFMLPMLRIAADGREHSLSSLRDRLQMDMNLASQDLAERLPSGTQSRYSNRVAWSSAYLTKAGALKRIQRGVVAITDRGKELLAENHSRITTSLLDRYPEFRAFRKRTPGSLEKRDTPSAKDNDSLQTPQEQLESSYIELRESLASQVLDAVKKSSPAFFEWLVVKLLVAMGYGGSLEDAGNAVGKAGDDGIDGIIKEDKLGLDVVYIQAKRWTDTPVGRPAIQAFVGSLEGRRARKGVMITTSSFSQDAKDYIRRIEKKIVLVDGKQLVDLMIEHNVGVVVAETYQVKRLEESFFDEE